MTDLQSSDAILNDLFSSIENDYGQKSSGDDETEEEASASEESVKAKSLEVSKNIQWKVKSWGFC